MIKKIYYATRHAFRGLAAMLFQELPFQLEVISLFILVPLAMIYGRAPLSRAVMIGVVMLVLIVEALNTGIEVVVDRISKERHHLSGLAKDIAAGAVFLSILNAIVVWAIILLG